MDPSAYKPTVPSYEDTKRHYIDEARAYVKQPTNVEWGASAEAVPFFQNITRGKQYTDLVHFLTFTSLRLGFLTQLFSLALLICMHHGHGSTNAWTFDFYNISDKLRSSSSLIYSITTVLAIYMLGTISLLLFQAFIADNGKYVRGFRAGSKTLQTAITLDLLTLVLRFASFLYAFRFLGDRWWSHLHQTRADFSISHFCSILHGGALMSYGVGIFYMEGYHDEGTYEEIGWISMILFSAAGFSEILMSFTGYGAFFAYIQLAALMVVTFWSFSFEPLMHYHMAALHDRTISDSALEMSYAQVDSGADCVNNISSRV